MDWLSRGRALSIAIVLHPHSKQRRLSRGCEPTEGRSGRTERKLTSPVSLRIGSVSERMIMSIRVTSGSRRHEASEASACKSTCVTAGRQIDGFARLRSGDGGPRSTTRCQLYGSRRELLGWSPFDGSARSLEEGSFPARVQRQLYVALHSRAEAPRLRRHLGTVLGRGPRQNLFWSDPSLLPKSRITTTNALHPPPKMSAISKMPQSQQNTLL